MRLTQIDPSFVSATEAALRLAGRFYFPTPKPNKRLPTPWQELLSTCLDVHTEIDLLESTVELMSPERFRKSDSTQTARESHLHVINWVIHEHALLDKLSLLMKRTTKVRFSRRNRSRFVDEFESIHRKAMLGIAARFENARHGAVHGASDIPTVFDGIAQDGLWEGALALEVPLEETIDAGYKEIFPQLASWHMTKMRQTQELFERTGRVLSQYQHDLSVFTENLPDS